MNQFRGPGGWNLDLSVFRSFPLGGTHRLEAPHRSDQRDEHIQIRQPDGQRHQRRFHAHLRLEYLVRRAAGAVRASIQLLNGIGHLREAGGPLPPASPSLRSASVC